MEAADSVDSTLHASAAHNDADKSETIDISPLEAPVPVAGVSAFLAVCDLMSLRTASRSSYHLVPRHTRTLVCTRLADVRAIALLTAYFPHVTSLALRGCRLNADELESALRDHMTVHWRSSLRSLHVAQTLHFGDAHVLLASQLLPKLETLDIAQCYLVARPTLQSARLKNVSITHCSFTRFRSASILPRLETLCIASQTLSTFDVRHLLQRALPASGASISLRSLTLSHCSAVAQVLIDPQSLPQLATFELTSCSSLTRVHVASQTLTTLTVTLCDALQHVVLDAALLQHVDLSSLVALLSMYIRAPTATTLDLSGCKALVPANVRVASPALQVVRLSGTCVTLRDLNRIDDDDMQLSLVGVNEDVVVNT